MNEYTRHFKIRPLEKNINCVKFNLLKVIYVGYCNKGSVFDAKTDRLKQ